MSAATYLLLSLLGQYCIKLTSVVEMIFPLWFSLSLSLSLGFFLNVCSGWNFPQHSVSLSNMLPLLYFRLTSGLVVRGEDFAWPPGLPRPTSVNMLFLNVHRPPSLNQLLGQSYGLRKGEIGDWSGHITSDS